MMTVLRDAQDRLQAVCEWWVVNEQGVTMPWGKYVWVNTLEMNPGVHGANMIRQIIQQIATTAPQAVGAYWEREQKTAHRLHAFRRIRLMHQLEKEVRV